MAILKIWPAVIGNPLLVLVKVFAPVPMATEDFVVPIMRPEPAPCSLIAFQIVTGVDQVNVPAGSVIVSPFNAALCKDCTFAADPSEWCTAPVSGAERALNAPRADRIEKTVSILFRNCICYLL